jgi:hypothetical protein
VATGTRKFGVLLHIHDVVMRQDAQPEQRAGAYVNCCVDASDSESAGRVAVGVLRSHPKYLELEAWPPGGRGAGGPPIEVDSVDVLSRWRRPFKRGINTGFVFYVDTGDEE